MKDNAKCRTRGGLGVNSNVTIRWSAYEFLFDFNRNYASILYLFRVIASYLSKVVYFNPPHLRLVPPVGGEPFRILPKPLISENQSPWPIVWCCLCDPKFSRFDTIAACDGRTDRRMHAHTNIHARTQARTHTHTHITRAYTALA